MTTPIRQFVAEMLAERGKGDLPETNTPLFTSGLLDSLAATELMLQLEASHGIDLADADFDISRLDTLGELEALIEAA